MRLLCVAFNAAIDRAYVAPGWRPGGEYRVRETAAVAGSKALNAARAARALGAEVVCTGIVAGDAGRWIVRELQRAGIASEFVDVPGESRTNVLVVDPASGSETRLLEPGVPVPPPALEAVRAAVLRLAAAADAVVLAGSLPPGVPDEIYAEITERLRPLGCRVAIDAHGGALRHGIASRPFVACPNRQELAELAGQPSGDQREMLRTMHAVTRAGPDYLAATLGPDGALLVARDGGAWHAGAPAITPRSTVGSGDAFLAGFMVASLRGEAAPDALRCAVAAGASNATRLAGGALDREEVRGLAAAVRVRAYAAPRM